jgi:hypothetical protein
MSITDDAQELMRREMDRECRENWGFGLDELPPMTPWEACARRDAINATNSVSFQKGRPTFRQREKIETYNKIAGRYRALADAELEQQISEINAAIRKEQHAGVYADPGINHGQNSAMITLWIVCLIGSFLGFQAEGPVRMFVPGGAALVAAVGYLFGWNKQNDDPRIAEAKRQCAKMHRYWTILR